MKFSTVAKGTKAEKPSTFRHGQTDVAVLLRPLTAGEEVSVISKATAAAIKAGVREPRPGDAIYEAHMMSETLAIACLDPDSSPEGRSPTFDGGAQQVLDLDNDTILVLFEQQRLWQEECSPSVRTKTTKELFALAKEVAANDDPFDYVRLSHATRWHLQRFTGALLLTSPAYKDLCSSYSSGDTRSGLFAEAKTTTPPKSEPAAS